MPIVLAIEPDRRQAAHLTAIVGRQAGAELILAGTTEGALDAIGDRVPDLVLVPALLSPQDDAALAAALRVIAVAAHVRTLTIPVLASGPKRAAAVGMLAKWRRSRAAAPEPDGCDPAVFGEQISTYLREVAAERAEYEEEPLDVRRWTVEAIPSQPVAPVEPPSLVDTPVPESIEPWAAAPVHDEGAEEHGPVAVAALMVSLSLVEPPVPESIEPWAAAPVHDEGAEEHGPVAVAALVVPLSLVEPPVPEPIEPWAAAPVQPGATDDNEQPLIDLSEELAGLADDAGDDTFDGERVGIYTISLEAEGPTLDDFDLLQAILEPKAVVPLAAAPIPEAPLDAQLADEPVLEAAALPREIPEHQAIARPAAAPIADEPGEALYVEPPEPPRADIEPWVPMYLTPGRLWPTLEGTPAEAPAPRTEQDDWIELVASLRQDLERRRADPPPANTDPRAARPSDGGEADTGRLAKKQKPQARKSKPVQDEWGFFDPEQCGFSTLLAKLEEITEEEVRS